MGLEGSQEGIQTIGLCSQTCDLSKGAIKQDW